MNGRDIELLKGNVVKKAQKEYFKEYFNLGLILCGDLKYVEEVKLHIINNYAYEKKIKRIKPTYAREKFSIGDEVEWQKYKKIKRKASCFDESEFFYFACILRGEVKILEEIKEYINQNKFIKLVKFIYSKRKIYIVHEFQKSL